MALFIVKRSWILCLGLGLGFSEAQLNAVSIANADFMKDPRFMVVSRMHSFQTKKIGKGGDTIPSFHFPMNTSLYIGISPRFQVGFDYGLEKQFSFSGKALLYDSQEKNWIPDVVLGVRSLYGSQEGYMYRVKNTVQVEKLTNEFYLSASSLVKGGAKIKMGLVINSRTEEKPVSIHAGFQQKLNNQLSIGYNTFQRYNTFHHQLNVTKEVYPHVLFSIGFQELQLWFFKEGSFGLYATPSELSEKAYVSPGVNVSVAFTFGNRRQKVKEKEEAEKKHKQKVKVVEKKKREQEQERLREIENLQIVLDKELGGMRKNLRMAQSQVREMQNTQRTKREKEEIKIKRYLIKISEKIESEAPFDPEDVLKLRKKIIGMRGASSRILKFIVEDLSLKRNIRLHAIIVMGLSQRSEFTKSLIKVTQDKDSEIRLEGILALRKLNQEVAEDVAESLLNDPSDLVVYAAEQALSFGAIKDIPPKNKQEPDQDIKKSTKP